MNKIITGMLFMVFAGSAIAVQPVLSTEQAKRLQELQEISNRNPDAQKNCIAFTARCLNLTRSEFKEYRRLLGRSKYESFRRL